jgi:hypothetical protein
VTVQWNDVPYNTIDGTCERFVQAVENAHNNSLIGWASFSGTAACSQLSYKAALNDFEDDDPWYYMTCKEFGYYQTTDSPNQPFGSMIPLSFYETMCKDLFNVTFNPSVINATNAKYGGKALLPNASNIAFVNGGIDPWHPLCQLKNLSSSLISYWIPESAHCAFEDWAVVDDPTINWVRNSLFQLLGNWTREFHDQRTHQTLSLQIDTKETNQILTTEKRKQTKEY